MRVTVSMKGQGRWIDRCRGSFAKGGDVAVRGLFSSTEVSGQWTVAVTRPCFETRFPRASTRTRRVWKALPVRAIGAPAVRSKGGGFRGVLVTEPNSQTALAGSLHMVSEKIAGKKSVLTKDSGGLFWSVNGPRREPTWIIANCSVPGAPEEKR